MRGDTEEAIRLLRVRERRHVKGWAKRVEPELTEHETVVGVIKGGPNQYGTGVLVLTDERLIAFDPSTGTTSLWHEDIAAVNTDRDAGRTFLVIRHLQLGEIVLPCGDVQLIEMFPEPRGYNEFYARTAELARLTPARQEQGDQGRAPTRSEELERLAGLLEAGHLTQEEFEAEKRRLLQ